MKMDPAAAAASLQSCLMLCNPIDGSPLGSSVPVSALWDQFAPVTDEAWPGG